MELKFFKSVILLFSLISQITKVVCETEKAARTLLPIKIIEEPSIFLANANLQNFQVNARRRNGASRGSQTRVRVNKQTNNIIDFAVTK